VALPGLEEAGGSQGLRGLGEETENKMNSCLEEEETLIQQLRFVV
jgi:hypothetical protein